MTTPEDTPPVAPGPGLPYDPDLHMYRPPRHRRGTYAMARTPVLPSLIRLAVLVGVVLLILWLLGRWILGFFDGSSSLQRAKVDLAAETGTVNIAIDGGLMQRAEGASKLYAGDKVQTGGNGRARLTFPDGTTVRLNAQTEVSIDRSDMGEESAVFALTLDRGELWIATPESGSGAVTRTVETPAVTFTFPADTKAHVGERWVSVFAADGEGVHAETADGNGKLDIGEGQKFLLPETGSAQSGRSALQPVDWEDAFVRASLGQTAIPGGSTDLTAQETLKVTAPPDNAVIREGTVKAQGTYGDGVKSVRVNGHAAILSEDARTFSLELALEGTGPVTLLVEALDDGGTVLESVRRTIRRDATPATAPTILKPAAAGQTYRTSASEIVISGEVPAATSAVYVNEYRLQLFQEGNRTWSYLARTDLNNLKPGSNVFNVTAVDAAGTRSPAATLTILLEAGTEGIVSSASGTASSAAPDESTLPKNDPLLPGTLEVTGPTAGLTHTQTGAELLIEGKTSAQTDSVWVNGYKLQLYKPGKTTWNYIAKVDYGNLKRGTNTYRIVVRNAKNEILDTVTYTVELGREER